MIPLAKLGSVVGYAMGTNLTISKQEIASAILFCTPSMCMTQVLILCWAAQKYNIHTRAIVNLNSIIFLNQQIIFFTQ